MCFTMESWKTSCTSQWGKMSQTFALTAARQASLASGPDIFLQQCALWSCVPSSPSQLSSRQRAIWHDDNCAVASMLRKMSPQWNAIWCHKTSVWTSASNANKPLCTALHPCRITQFYTFRQMQLQNNPAMHKMRTSLCATSLWDVPRP